METIKAILIRRDGVSEEEADALIEEAKDKLNDLLLEGNLTEAENICETYFNLEPDYLFELID